MLRINTLWILTSLMSVVVLTPACNVKPADPGPFQQDVQSFSNYSGKFYGALAGQEVGGEQEDLAHIQNIVAQMSQDAKNYSNEAQPDAATEQDMKNLCVDAAHLMSDMNHLMLYNNVSDKTASLDQQQWNQDMVALNLALKGKN